MRKSQFTEVQTVEILRKADKSLVSEVSKKHGISQQTIYSWRHLEASTRTPFCPHTAQRRFKMY